MASSKEDISVPTNETENPVIGSCMNDPNYAIICAFLQKFGSQLKIEHPNIVQLQKMIENTDEVHETLKQFMVRLLRKTRKSVQPDKLDSALAKFCYTYSSQDAWEIERFGYKKASLAVKLRIIKEILESQFEKNPTFRTVVTAQNASDLRSQPLGKDKLGNAYWSTMDDQCNMRIYQEHLDEEIWKIVATNRDELVKLISCLKGNELVMPSLVGVVDEDSSSNSMPPKVDALQNVIGNGNQNGHNEANESKVPATKENVPNLKIKLNNDGASTVEQINPTVEKENYDENEDDSNISEIDESSQAASESSATTVGTKSTETQNSKRYSLLASKPPSNKSKHRVPGSDSREKINDKIKNQTWSSNKRNLEGQDSAPNSKRPSMMSGKKNENKYKDEDTDDSLSDEAEEEYEDGDEEEIEDEEMSEISDGDVGEEIEEPTMYVRGEGSGRSNKCGNNFNDLESDCDDASILGEAIEEDIFYVVGEGSGFDCDVGNTDIKTTEASTNATTVSTPVPAKPMFFFGQAGCLKLSPIKTVRTSSTDTKDKTSDSSNTTQNESENVSDNDQKSDDDLNDVQPEKSTNDETQAEAINSEESEDNSTVNNNKGNEINVPEVDNNKEELSKAKSKSESDKDLNSESENKIENEKLEENITSEQIEKENEQSENQTETEIETEIGRKETKSEQSNLPSNQEKIKSDTKIESIEPGHSVLSEVNNDVKENEENELQIEEKREYVSEILEKEKTDCSSSSKNDLDFSNKPISEKSSDEIDQNENKEEYIVNQEQVNENKNIDKNEETFSIKVNPNKSETLSELSQTEEQNSEKWPEIEINESELVEISNTTSIEEKIETQEQIPSEVTASQSSSAEEQQEPCQNNDTVLNESQNPLIIEITSKHETEFEPISEMPERRNELNNEVNQKRSESKQTPESILPIPEDNKEAQIPLTELNTTKTILSPVDNQLESESQRNLAPSVSDEKVISISEKRKGDELKPEEKNICKKKREETVIEVKSQEVIKEKASVSTVSTSTKKDHKITIIIPESPEISDVTINEPIVKSPVPIIEVTKSPDVTTASFFQSDVVEPNKLSAPIASPKENELELKQKLEAEKARLSPPTPSSPKQHPVEFTARTRKRRISGEKVRLSSESENDCFDQAAEIADSPTHSDDDEVGGKRLKMRARVSLRNLRKSIEDKRKQKEIECSSDDNEKIIAKQKVQETQRPKLRTRQRKPQSAEIIVSEKLKPIELLPELKEKVKLEQPGKIEEAQVEKYDVVNEGTNQEDDNSDDEKDVKVKSEDANETEVADDEESQVVTPRKTGRPSRRGGRKAAARARAVARVAARKGVKKEAVSEIKEEVKEEKKTPIVTAPVKATTAPKSGPRKKKRSLLGLDIDDAAIITAAADETPVRQSRRIAQIKIKEEAERRKAEEVALEKMKAASEKKKKGPPSTPRSASEEENSESERKLEKKKKKKKGNKDRPWQTDSSDPSERDEEDIDDHEEVERLPPLRSDHEFSPESDIEDESQIVPTKRARTARKDVTEKDAEKIEGEDIHACQKCSKNDHPEWILLCDKCDKGYHCSCLIPVLFVIPEGNWFCPPCQQEKLIEELEAKLIEFDTAVKAKEAEEQRQQRILFNTINAANVLKESKRDKQRARAERKSKYNESEDYSSTSSSDDDSDNNGSGSNEENDKKRSRNTHRTRKRSESSATNSSDDEPIYKLRKRRQANVSYRFNEFDEMINRAIKTEMDEVAGAGNLGRGKDISTIIEADKEERRLKKVAQDKSDDDIKDNKSKHTDSNSDSEPIRPKVVNRTIGKKKKKLNSLDDESDYDDRDSDDDFKTSSFSEDEEENYSESSADSESSLEPLSRKKGRKFARRSGRERKKRFEADFIDDNSDDDDIPLIKKKRKEDSEFSDFNDSSEEVEEDVDSEDLCDDSTDESDRPWQRSGGKTKKSSTKSSSSNPLQKKKSKNEDDSSKAIKKKKTAIISDDEDEDDDDEDAEEVLPKSRRTRGKKLPYLLDDDFDSSDDGIKPGVKRPDTPPEERAAFIQKQEEIKRMLAEKNADKPATEKPKRNAPKDSLSTIPANIIQTAKALDVDLKKSALLNKSDNDSNGFDDDLPEDFDPEDMDEDEIAKMMEEEGFAQHQLKLAGEAIRSKKNREVTEEKKELPPMKIDTETLPIMSSHINSVISPTTFAGSLTIPDIPPSMYNTQSTSTVAKITTTPKKRGRKTKEEPTSIAESIPKVTKNMEPILPLKEPIPLQTSTIQHTSMQQQKQPTLPIMHPGALAHSPPIQIPQSVISHSSLIRPPPIHQPLLLSSVPSIVSPPSSLLGIARNQEPIIPTAVLDVQNTRLLDPSELGQPPISASLDPNPLDSAIKKRGRRKKFTPTKEQGNAANTGIDLRNAVPSTLSTSAPAASVIVPETKISSILSERLTSNPSKVDNKRVLSVASPPHLYSSPTNTQPSVITRLVRPGHNVPFSSGNPQPQRYFSPNHSLPPHSLPSHVRPSYHSPNVSVAPGHRQQPLPNVTTSSSHLTHPMYMRRGQPSLYPPGYHGIPPPQMHRGPITSASPQEFTGPYQNLPFAGYYAPPAPTSAHLASSVERRSGTIVSTFEQFDNVNKAVILPHDRGSATSYSHHHSSTSITTLTTAGRHPEVEDERSAGSGSNGPHETNTAAGTGSGSEFSGLVSYFSSQQDDLDT